MCLLPRQLLFQKLALTNWQRRWILLVHCCCCYWWHLFASFVQRGLGKVKTHCSISQWRKYQFSILISVHLLYIVSLENSVKRHSWNHIAIVDNGIVQYIRAVFNWVSKVIHQFWYIKIQPNTIDISTRLWGIGHKRCSYSPEPRAEVYCFRLNFNISKSGY